MSRRRIATALFGGLGCFALGLGVARLLGAGSPPPVEPRIVFDPASIDLLPDASLRLDLPHGFGGGTGAVARPLPRP